MTGLVRRRYSGFRHTQQDKDEDSEVADTIARIKSYKAFAAWEPKNINKLEALGNEKWAKIQSM